MTSIILIIKKYLLIKSIYFSSESFEQIENLLPLVMFQP